MKWVIILFAVLSFLNCATIPEGPADVPRADWVRHWKAEKAYQKQWAKTGEFERE